MSANVTNEQVAKDLGVTHSTVSRLRAGYRMPSFDLMMEIERLYAWSIKEQAQCRMDATAVAWHEGFETALAIRFGSVESVSP